jgi:nucleoside-diphosphate-sugar epimerase
MKILVTGASGFVGGSFMRRFAGRSDLDVLGVARRATGLPNYTQRDLSLPFDLDINPDVVIHAAARASPWGSQRSYHAQNVLATANVIDYCQRHGHPRLIYVSSSSVFYREEHQLGLTEASPIGPNFINAYAQTKYMGEELVCAYPGEKVVLRPRAVFGPGDTVLFPRILEAAAKGKLPLFTGQEQPVLGDLIYIDVLCDYLLAAAIAQNISGSYNLTNARPIEVQVFLLQILKRLGLAAPTRQVSVSTALRAATVAEWVYRFMHLQGEPPITRFGVGVFAYSKTFDVSRALQDLGPPSVSLEEGVERFIAWQKQQWP